MWSVVILQLSIGSNCVLASPGIQHDLVLKSVCAPCVSSRSLVQCRVAAPGLQESIRNISFPTKGGVLGDGFKAIATIYLGRAGVRSVLALLER